MDLVKTTSGRGASASIVRALREALESGVPMSRPELARRAKCSERSVQNYLRDAEQALGVRVRKERGDDRVVRFVASPEGAAETIDQLAHALAHDMLRRVFPIEGTKLGRRGSSRPQIVVSVRGAFTYEERHLRIVRRWLQAGNERPRRAVRFEYLDKGAIVAWPIGILVRDLARVYLAGVPQHAERATDVRTYALERIATTAPVKLVEAMAPEGIDAARIEDAIDDPFSVFKPGPDAVMVHLRFPPEQAKYVRGRLWHRKQKEKLLKDGSLELTLGPADLGEAAAWVASWLPGVEVLGDERLIAKLHLAPSLGAKR